MEKLFLQYPKCTTCRKAKKFLQENNVNFNDMPTEYRRGVCCIRTENGWKIDKEIPVFTKNREYIEKYI